MIVDTVLVTGLGGLLGRHLRAAVPDLPWRPVEADGKRVDLLDADALAFALDAAPEGPVVHLAAFTDVTAAWRQAGDRDGDCYRLNVTGTHHVVDACRKTGRYLVHVSTDYVFSGDGGPSGTPGPVPDGWAHDGPAYDEGSVPDARDWYGLTKLLAEQEVLAGGVPAAIARLAHPFGPAGVSPRPDLVAAILHRLRGGEPVALFADTVITPSYLPDVAACLAALVRRRPTGVFHTVGATPLSPYALAVAVAGAAGLDPGAVTPTRHEDHVAAGNRPYPRDLALVNRRTGPELGVRMRGVPEALADLLGRERPAG